MHSQIAAEKNKLESRASPAANTHRVVTSTIRHDQTTTERGLFLCCRRRAVARATGNLTTAESTRAVRSIPQALGAQLQQQRHTWAAISGASQSFNNDANGHSNSDDASRATWSGILVMASGLLAAAATFSAENSHQTPAQCEAAPQLERAAGQQPDQKKVYPVVSKAEVAKHTSKEAGGVWVTYDGGVYDITEFIANHPGGSSRISMAAGGALEPFWQLYALHKKDEVLDILATLRIGSLSEEDMADDKEKAKGRDSDDPYAKVTRRASSSFHYFSLRIRRCLPS